MKCLPGAALGALAPLLLEEGVEVDVVDVALVLCVAVDVAALKPPAGEKLNDWNPGGIAPRGGKGIPPMAPPSEGPPIRIAVTPGPPERDDMNILEFRFLSFFLPYCGLVMTSKL